jgi:DNA ligase 1
VPLALESARFHECDAQVLSDFFRSVICLTPQDLLPIVYLCCNRLAPAYAGIELGIGDSILIKAVCLATGRTPADVKAAAQKTGDLGVVAETSRGKQAVLMRPKPLTVRGVYSECEPWAEKDVRHGAMVTGALKDIAGMKGNKSQGRKVERIRTLLAAAATDSAEARYIIRGLQGKLRVGLAEKTVIVSLAHAVTITPPNNPAVQPVDAPDASASNAASSSDASASNAASSSDASASNAVSSSDASASNAASSSDASASNTACVAEEARFPSPVPPVRGGEGNTYARVLDARSPKGRMRQEETVSAELAEAVELLKHVYSELPSYDEIIPRLLEGGTKRARETCSLTPGIPVAPMLAKPTKGVAEILDRFESVRFTCEYKYDGERAQVHCLPGSGRVRVFSRNSEETSVKYPDLAKAIPEAAKEGVSSYILDGEVVAYDRVDKKLLPFQKLSTRARKVGIAWGWLVSMADR